MREKKEYAILSNNISKRLNMNGKEEKIVSKPLWLFWETSFPIIHIFPPFELNYFISDHKDARAICLSYHLAVRNPMLIGLFLSGILKLCFPFF